METRKNHFYHGKVSTVTTKCRPSTNELARLFLPNEPPNTPAQHLEFPETKLITLTNHNRHKQRNEPIRTRGVASSAGNCVPASYDWFSSTSDWLKNWRQIF